MKIGGFSGAAVPGCGGICVGMTSVVVAVLSALDDVAIVVVDDDCTPPGSPSCDTVAVAPPRSPTVSLAGAVARVSVPWSCENGIPIRTAHTIAPQTRTAIGSPKTHQGRAVFTATTRGAVAEGEVVAGAALAATGTAAGEGGDATAWRGNIIGSVSARSSSTATFVPQRGQ